MRKVLRFLGSMRLAIVLMALLALACIAGSLIPQGLAQTQYAARYSERGAALLVGLRLDDVFHAWWFLALTVCLCGNLLFCNLRRLPQLLRRTREAADPALRGQPTVTVEGVADPEAVFARLRMPKPAETADAEGRPLRFSVRSRLGLWGAWVCHLGVVLLVAGFALGQITMEQYTLYGVPGQIKQLGDTDCFVKIQDFRVDRAEDGFVEQYTASLTVFDAPEGREVRSEDAVVSVNHPGSAYGYKFYQNSTGDAARLTVQKDGKTVQEEFLCAGEYTAVLNSSLSLLLQGVEAEYDTAADGSPVAGYVYQIYIENEFYTMGVQREGESIPDFRPVEVRFSEPQSYTLIQVKRDRFAPLAFAGGLITLLGMLLAFYFQTQKLWAIRQEDGTWTLYGQNRKGGVLFAERVRAAAETGKEGEA